MYQLSNQMLGSKYQTTFKIIKKKRKGFTSRKKQGDTSHGRTTDSSTSASSSAWGLTSRPLKHLYIVVVRTRAANRSKAKVVPFPLMVSEIVTLQVVDDDDELLFEIGRAHV